MTVRTRFVECDVSKESMSILRKAFSSEMASSQKGGITVKYFGNILEMLPKGRDLFPELELWVDTQVKFLMCNEIIY